MKHLFLIGLLFLAITGQAQEQQAKEYFEAGEKHRKARRYKEAIVAYETAASYNPTMSDAYVQKGRCQFILKEYEGAAETFEQIIEISPQTFEAYNSLWKIYGIQEKPEQMIQTYERAAEAATKPELKQLYLLKIADFLDKSDRTTDMLPYLEQAKEINSDAPELQYLWGKYHVNQEQYKEALPYLEGAYAQTKAKPIKESGQYLYLLGYTYAQLDRYLDALPILKKITEGPYQPMAYRLLPEYHYYVGAAYHDLYQPEAAKAALERALRIDPTYEPANRLLVSERVILERAGELAQAQLQKMSVESDPQKQLQARKQISELYLQGKRYTDAERLATQYLEANPNDISVQLIRWMAQFLADPQAVTLQQMEQKTQTLSGADKSRYQTVLGLFYRKINTEEPSKTFFEAVKANTQSDFRHLADYELQQM